MNNIQNVNPNLTATSAIQMPGVPEAPTAATPSAQPLLTQPSVTVTSAPSSDLEKLVARLQNEHNERKAAVAQQRLASVLDLYAARYGDISEKKAQAVETIAGNAAEIIDKSSDLSDTEQDLSSAQADLVVKEAAIKRLEQEVAQAIKDGETHRENIARLKEQIAHDKDNVALKVALLSEQAALEQSQKALDKAQTNLSNAQAEAGALSAKIKGLADKTETLKGEIAALQTANKALIAMLGTPTVKNLLAVFREEEIGADIDRGPSPFDERKSEEKILANSLAKLLHEAMENMDEDILRDIDENRDRTV